MIFGSISYLNLLPFQIFLKKHIRSSQIKQIIFYKKGVPSVINKQFLQKKVDAAFISSIASKNKKCTNLGIVGFKNVYSVLLLPNEKIIKDNESASSNHLVKKLNLKGKVLIGDKALLFYLRNSKQNFKDLSLEWYKKHKLPFVFARLCYNKHAKKIKKIALLFSKQKIKIPQYYLKKAAKEKSLSPKELLWYLKHIQYKIGWQEEKALKKFLKK